MSSPTSTPRPMRALLPLLAALTAVASTAQPTAAQPAPTVHAVPFGSTGNAVELELAAVDGADLAGVEVVVAAAPTWLRFDLRDAPSADDGPSVARLAFDVAREAPVGEPAEVAFEVRVGGAVVATHAVRLEVAAPAELALRPAYPNPARGAVTVPFELPSEGAVRVVAYDVLGREAGVLLDERRRAGAHELRVDLSAFATGAYVVRLTAGGETRVGRLTVVR